MIVLGTAIRCVSRYSESLITREGSTIAVRDLFERLPLNLQVSHPTSRMKAGINPTSVFVVKL